MKLETVKVKHEGRSGYKIINKSDMTEADKLYTEHEEVKAKPKPKKKAPEKADT